MITLKPYIDKKNNESNVINPTSLKTNDFLDREVKISCEKKIINANKIKNAYTGLNRKIAGRIKPTK